MQLCLCPESQRKSQAIQKKVKIVRPMEHPDSVNEQKVLFEPALFFSKGKLSQTQAIRAHIHVSIFTTILNGISHIFMFTRIYFQLLSQVLNKYAQINTVPLAATFLSSPFQRNSVPYRQLNRVFPATIGQ